MALEPNDFKCKREELTKTFMMISKVKKPFGPHDLYKNNSAL